MWAFGIFLFYPVDFLVAYFQTLICLPGMFNIENLAVPYLKKWVWSIKFSINFAFTFFLFRSTDYSTPESARVRRKPYEPSLTSALLKTFWVPLLLSGLLKLVNDLTVFVAPQLLKYVLPR